MSTTIIATDTEIEDDFAPLSDAEKQELIACEERASMGNAQAAISLKAIHDKKLYREEFSRWEDYVEERWGHSKSYSHQLLFFAEMCNLIMDHQKSAIGRLLVLPTSERQVRPLAKVIGNANRRDVWLKAVKRANGRHVSGALIAAIISEMARDQVKAHVPALVKTPKPKPHLNKSDEAIRVAQDKDSGDAIAATHEIQDDAAANITLRICEAPRGNVDEDASELHTADVPDCLLQIVSSEAAPAHQDKVFQAEIEAVPLTLVSTETQATGDNTVQAEDLAAACRDVVAAALDNATANRIYEAVRTILADLLRQAA